MAEENTLTDTLTEKVSDLVKCRIEMRATIEEAIKKDNKEIPCSTIANVLPVATEVAAFVLGAIFSGITWDLIKEGLKKINGSRQLTEITETGDIDVYILHIYETLTDSQPDDSIIYHISYFTELEKARSEIVKNQEDFKNGVTTFDQWAKANGDILRKVSEYATNAKVLKAIVFTEQEKNELISFTKKYLSSKTPPM